MMMNLSKTKDREQFIHFIGPQSIETAQLLTKKNITIDIKSLDYFKNYPVTLVINKGHFMVKYFKKN